MINTNTDNITIYCYNTKQYKEVPVGSSLLEIYAMLDSPLHYRPLSARVNSKVEDLSYQCWQPRDIEFVDYTSPPGYRTYFRSLCFVLGKAVNDLFPNMPFDFEHSIAKGFYCAFESRRQLLPDEVEQIKIRMQEIIDADIPFLLRKVRTPNAIELFRSRGMEDKALLLETSGLSYSSYYELDGYIDYFYSALTPSSGYLHTFDVIPYEEGLLLLVPERENPTKLPPLIKQDKMFAAYKEHLALMRLLSMNNAGELNRAILDGRTSNVVMVSEAMQEKQISKIAEQIAQRYAKGVRVVLISGPSSSGKTTFSKRLQIQLMTNFLHPIGISLDDYYVNREDTPLDEDGHYDFESLYAIDLPYLYNDLSRLIAGEEIEIPSFDFELGKRVYRGEKLQLRENSVLLLEGIHGLNPELTGNMPPETLFRIYVSALTTISLDGHNWIPTTDNRLLRRIVRDFRSRGYTAKDTIRMWPRVRKGEDKWIFPYQENADAMFNSAMLYEFAALRKFAEPILSEIREIDEESAEAYRLLRFLRYFNYIPLEELPRASLLREFIGGGTFE